MDRASSTRAAWPVWLVTDGETIKVVYRGRFAAFQQGLGQGGRMLEQSAGECVQRLIFTLNVYFHLAGAVAHPAAQLKGLRQAIGKRSKAYPLNLAGQGQVQCLDGGWRGAGNIQIHGSNCRGYTVACRRFGLTTGSRMPPDHQIRQAPSSDTMQGPMGWRGLQATPNRRHSLG